MQKTLLSFTGVAAQQWAQFRFVGTGKPPFALCKLLRCVSFCAV